MGNASRGIIWVATMKNSLQTTERRLLPRNSNIFVQTYWTPTRQSTAAARFPLKTQSPINSHIALLSIILLRTGPIATVHLIHSIYAGQGEKWTWMTWTPSPCVLLRFSVTLMAPKVTSAGAGPSESLEARRLRPGGLSLSAEISGTPPPRLILSPGSASPSSDI